MGLEQSNSQLNHEIICGALRDLGYQLCNLKKLKNTHGGVLLLVKLQAKSLQLY